MPGLEELPLILPQSPPLILHRLQLSHPPLPLLTLLPQPTTLLAHLPGVDLFIGVVVGLAAVVVVFVVTMFFFVSVFLFSYVDCIGCEHVSLSFTQPFLAFLYHILQEAHDTSHR